MGKQFKTISSLNISTSEYSSQIADKETIHLAVQKHSARDLQPLLRLPTRSFAEMSSAPRLQSTSIGEQHKAVVQHLQSQETPVQGRPDNRLSSGSMLIPLPGGPFISPMGSTSGPAQSYAFVPPPSAVQATVHRITGGKQQFEAPRAPAERGSLSRRNAAPRSLAQAQQKKQKRRGRGVVTFFMTVSCCLCLLVLSGGGYWFFHLRGTSPSSVPATLPTQTTYTLTSAAPTVAPTAIPATAIPTATLAPSPTAVPTLSPVPLPWQTNSSLIVVSITKQRLTAYANGKALLTTLVTTGMPDLYTPEGTYHIIGRIANTMFTSPWPPGSPYYYAPIHVNYGLQLTSSGIYLHDATWRSVFGPGTNVPHTDPVYGKQTGSHGCVELPLQAMSWLYQWAPGGIAVAVVD